MPERSTKPLGHRAYGSIGHLPDSRLGPGDHHVHEGQARICTERARDRHDLITVQEKLDGSCVAVANHKGAIIALGRRGYLAETSPFEMHHLFADWVRLNGRRFAAVLNDGERLVGEWLAQAHGTKYELPHEPFVAFDLMRKHERVTVKELTSRVALAGFVTPSLIHQGFPISVAAVRTSLDQSAHGAQGGAEGAVWRVERRGKVDFLAKWVRPDKVDGCYLPEVSGEEAVWNWRPARG
ncbi:MAG: hypothetical protein IIC87_06825 [Chloroflexi bacterium]|nr:hypothetical protein [Chloroflexota bacterium]